MSVQIINLLIKYENTLAALYEECAKKFPEHASFWKSLAGEEKRHAQNITNLLQKVDNQTVFLEDNRFKINPLKISIEYAEEVIEKVKDGKLPLKSILSIASSIENSILEANYYELFAGDSVSLNHYLKQLKDESAVHLKRIDDLLETVRRSHYPG